MTCMRLRERIRATARPSRSPPVIGRASGGRAPSLVGAPKSLAMTRSHSKRLRNESTVDMPLAKKYRLRRTPLTRQAPIGAKQTGRGDVSPSVQVERERWTRQASERARPPPWSRRRCRARGNEFGGAPGGTWTRDQPNEEHHASGGCCLVSGFHASRLNHASTPASGCMRLPPCLPLRIPGTSLCSRYCRSCAPERTSFTSRLPPRPLRLAPAAPKDLPQVRAAWTICGRWGAASCDRCRTCPSCMDSRHVPRNESHRHQQPSASLPRTNGQVSSTYLHRSCIFSARRGSDRPPARIRPRRADDLGTSPERQHQQWDRRRRLGRV